MDLPVDKIRILREYDNDKKWQLVKDQRGMASINVTHPSVYLDKIRLYMDKTKSKKVFHCFSHPWNLFSQKKKLLGDDNSTSVLNHMAISLRTNSVEYVSI